MLKTHPNRTEKNKCIIEVIFASQSHDQIGMHMLLLMVKDMLTGSGALGKFITLEVGKKKAPKSISMAAATFGMIKVAELESYCQGNAFFEKIKGLLTSNGISGKMIALEMRAKPLPQLITPEVVHVHKRTWDVRSA